MAHLKLSYKALSKLSDKAILEPSSLAPDMSYAALSSSSLREGARGFNADLWSVLGFNADLWRIGTNYVAFQASRFLYK